MMIYCLSFFDLSQDANKKAKIRKGATSSYSDVTALGIDKTAIVSGYIGYQAYADITPFIKNNGNTFSNTTNPKDNLWNGTVTNKGANYIRMDNLSNLPSGNYILQLVSPNGKIIQKIMK